MLSVISLTWIAQSTPSAMKSGRQPQQLTSKSRHGLDALGKQPSYRPIQRQANG